MSDSQKLILADELFAAGKFAHSAAVYREHGGDSAGARFRLAQIALLENRLDAATGGLRTIERDDAQFAAAQGLLGHAYYRQGEYALAATYFGASGRPALAEKLHSFGAVEPYRAGGADRARLAFVATAPLPAIRVEVNGLPAVMVLDTGTNETVLDVEFAHDAGAVANGFETNVFAGGHPDAVRHGRIDGLALGGCVLANVPVQMGAVRDLFGRFFREPVAGIIGLGVLQCFGVEFDIAGAELRLRRASTKAAAPAAGCVEVPFWLTEDLHMIAWGAINRDHPVLMLIDTGQVGFDFAAPLSTVQSAQIELQSADAADAERGGGAVRVAPFELGELRLGAAALVPAQGALEARFPLERRYGFRIGGLLAYDFFRHYALSLDFSAMRLYLQRHGGS